MLWTETNLFTKQAIDYYAVNQLFADFRNLRIDVGLNVQWIVAKWILSYKMDVVFFHGSWRYRVKDFFTCFALYEIRVREMDA